MNQSVEKNARITWDYMQLNQTIEKADAIFVLCSLDTRVAQTAAQLFLQGYGGFLIVSGGFGTLTEHHYAKPEADVFADIAIAAGVPPEKIIIENQSSNTGENVRFTYELLRKQQRNFSSLLLVQKPYMERRTFATFAKQWPDHTTIFRVTSPKIPFDEYFTEEMNENLVISIMVGDLQRIREYPALGFQIEQEIPDDVWNAFEALVDMGYTKHLL